MEDSADATDAYITGKIQWVTASLVNSDKLIASDKLEVFPMFGTTYFFFVCDQAPWSDWRVRRGLALLAPWDQVRSKDVFFFPSDLLIPSIPGYPSVKGIAAQNIEEGKSCSRMPGIPTAAAFLP